MYVTSQISWLGRLFSVNIHQRFKFRGNHFNHNNRAKYIAIFRLWRRRPFAIITVEI